MYVEPCCIDKELPRLLREDPFCFFQSNGDWTVRELMRSVSFLVPGSACCLLVIPEVDVNLLRELRHYLLRDGWYRSLALLTYRNQMEMVSGELSDCMPRVHYAVNRRVLDGQFGLFDEEGNYLLVSGPMLLKKDFTLCHFTAWRGKSSRQFRSAFDGELPMLRMNPVLVTEDPLLYSFITGKEIMEK